MKKFTEKKNQTHKDECVKTAVKSSYVPKERNTTLIRQTILLSR